jgi:hypothetical protein
MQQEELHSAANVDHFHGVRAQEVFPDESVSSQATPSSRSFEWNVYVHLEFQSIALFLCLCSELVSANSL